MKINGKKIPDTNIEVVVIPRGEEELVFKACMVKDYKKLEELCKEPQPNTKRFPDGRVVPDYDDPTYKKAVGEYNKQRNAWIILESLSATDGLEWETVKADDCTTWPNYMQELEDTGFSDTEIGEILQIVIDANGMNQQRIKRATSDFLQRALLEQSTESDFPQDAK